MTWVLKQRGTTAQPIAAEYMCPAHGRFTLTVDRDENGDPPAEAKCGEWISTTAYCGEWSPYVISAPHGRTRYGEVEHRGKQDEPPPGALRTDRIADGMSMSEYRKQRADRSRDRALANMRSKF